MQKPAHVVPKSTCPRCGYVADRAGSLSGKSTRPKPGDLSVCIGCGGMLRFDEGLRLEILPPTELLQLHRDDPELAAELHRAQRIVRDKPIS